MGLNKASLFLFLVLLSLLLLLLPDTTSSAPVPAPAPIIPPGVKIGALLGAGLILKAYLIANALSGESEDDTLPDSYGAPAPSYGAPSYKPSYKPSYNG